jgi:2-isopropylmalate synthase
MSQIELYDTTLRDGAQYEGISLSVEDKLAITRRLDQLGIHYIEGGWPGSNPKDAEYFSRVTRLHLAHATISAFGSTRYAGLAVEDDANIRALLDCDAAVLTLVGKSWDLHVTRVLETSLEENLAMIADSVAYLRAQGRRVFFDAEHFFDGFKASPDYALQTVRAAAAAGAERIVLCDTNGGTMPDEVGDVVAAVRRETDVALGIHTHNDADMAVAGALSAVRAGVTQIQGTINGYGERCGNANLLSIIANLKLKMGIDCVTDDQLHDLTEAGLFVAEVANMPPVSSQPYVGSSAFAHKGGLHASAVAKVEHSYQHVPPAAVGNAKRVLVSELSGRSNIRYKVDELEMGVDLTDAQSRQLLVRIKAKESEGFQYEGAEASFEMLVRRMLPDYEAPFSLVEYMIVVGRHPEPAREASDATSQAIVKVQVDGQVMHTAADGNGPVEALDHALRKALLPFYPSLETVRLMDYKVRVVDQGEGTGATVRVLIESTDGHRTWSTVGSSENIIEASWMALSDSLEYWLARQGVAGSSLDV